MMSDLTPGQLLAHKKIKALQKVYDAAREVLLADTIAGQFPTDRKSADRLEDAMGMLESAVWNTAKELGESYP